MDEETLRERFHTAKPLLKMTSINAYISKIKCINKELGSDNPLDLGVLLETDLIEEFLSNKKMNTQKTYLGCIISILTIFYPTETALLTYYRNQLEEYQRAVNERTEKQIKTESQEKNWTSIAELKKVIDTYKKTIDEHRLIDKATAGGLTRSEFMLYQKYVVGMLYVGDIHNNPALRLDYAPMKIVRGQSNYKEGAHGNSLIILNPNEMFFELVNYKTESTYGLKQIYLGDILLQVINDWLKVNTSSSLLINARGGQMKSNDLSKFIVKVFAPTGKKIGATLIRHITISELYPARLTEQKHTADLMAHSVDTQNTYSKII